MKFKSKKLLIAISLTFSLFYIESASAASCDPGIYNNVIQDQERNKNLDAKSEGGSPSKITDTGSNGLFGCTDGWPSISTSLSIPDISEIIRKAAQEVVDKACNLARDAVAEKISAAQQSMSIDTNGIEGLSELGISNINLGSASTSTSTGSSSGANGSISYGDSTWSNSVTSSFK